MKKIIKHIRIAVANIFYSIGHKIDATDRFDIEADMMRVDPNYSNPKKTNTQ